jgi:hypothetical protein
MTKRVRVRYLSHIWLAMLIPPWREAEPGGRRFSRLFYWIVGWVWALAGIILGAVIAPYLLGIWELANSPYQDALVIGIAAIAGFVVQFLGWRLMVILFSMHDRILA